ncbi:acyl-CoA dehydrogenase family protein [Dyadobacter pollutisoli]|uniref:acyl-CoA dehydrogenase family protein n=1 Tax=Dyadobacter pollutisoli TaxID=2910158 RepID=UPI0035B5A58C
MLNQYQWWGKKQHFPKEVFHKLGDLGLMGKLVQQRFGGLGPGYKEYAMAIIEL